MRRNHSTAHSVPCGVFRWLAGAAFLALLVGGPVPAAARTVKIVAFGDSLTAGYLLPADAAFPAVLEKALRQDGFDVAIANAGVSGDTTAGGLERVDWSVPPGTDGVILELGANDMLRGQDPALTRSNLVTLVEGLQARHVSVFLAGMLATPTLGADYEARFNAIYPDLAQRYRLPLDRFFLAGVMGVQRLQLTDGLHPNAAGVAAMVERIRPAIETWLKSMASP